MGIIETVRNELTRQEWTFHEEDDEDVIFTNAKGKNGSYRVHVRADEEKERLIINVYSAVIVPEEERCRAAEFLTRANYGLILGNFEMDFSDGEVRYKNSADIEAGKLSMKMVENMLDASLVSMDHYFGGLLSVCYGGKDPETAYNDCRGGSSSRSEAAALGAIVSTMAETTISDASRENPAEDSNNPPVVDATPVFELDGQ